MDTTGIDPEWKHGVLRVIAARQQMKLIVLKTIIGPLEPGRHYTASAQAAMDWAEMVECARELVAAEDAWDQEKKEKAAKRGMLYTGLDCQSPSEDTGTKSS